jgi:hypothetical protein
MHFLAVRTDAYGAAVPRDARGGLDMRGERHLCYPISQVLSRRLHARIGNTSGPANMLHLPAALDGARLAE